MEYHEINLQALGLDFSNYAEPRTSQERERNAEIKAIALTTKINERNFLYKKAMEIIRGGEEPGEYYKQHEREPAKSILKYMSVIIQELDFQIRNGGCKTESESRCDKGKE